MYDWQAIGDLVLKAGIGYWATMFATNKDGKLLGAVQIKAATRAWPIRPLNALYSDAGGIYVSAYGTLVPGRGLHSKEAPMIEDTLKRRQLRAMQHAREANVAALLTAFAIGMVVFQVFGP
jgi:hypothetical protein